MNVYSNHTVANERVLLFNVKYSLYMYVPLIILTCELKNVLLS